MSPEWPRAFNLTNCVHAQVALKRIKIADDKEFPVTAAREIKILQRLKHENIVTLREVVLSGLVRRNFPHC